MGFEKRISQESYRTESIRILAKRNPMFIVARQNILHPPARKRRVPHYDFLESRTPPYPYPQFFVMGPIYILLHTVLHGRLGNTLCDVLTNDIFELILLVLKYLEAQINRWLIFLSPQLRAPTI